MTDITAIYNGKKISELPEDLFIPPEYLRIILEEFEGPLDLLLYLIKKKILTSLIYLFFLSQNNI